MAWLWRRVTWRGAFAAAPDLVLAGVFLGVGACGADWVGRDDLELWLTFELLVVHAVPFLMAAIVAVPRQWWHHPARWGAFGGLLALYVLTAHREAGPTGVAALFGLGFATYLGFFLGIGRERMPDVGARWLVNTLSLVFVVAVPVGAVRMLCGAPTVALNEDVWIGVWYFALLGLYELFGLYDALRETRETARAEQPRQAQR